jgi:transposase
MALAVKIRAHLWGKKRVSPSRDLIGEQGRELLDALFDATAPEWLRLVPAAEILRQVWVQNYQRVDDAVRWRSSENIPPPSRYIGSPYDEAAHYSKKRSTTWVGYKVHLTESCEAHLPLLITHVETTSAPISDDTMTATIHADAAAQGAFARRASRGDFLCRRKTPGGKKARTITLIWWDRREKTPDGKPRNKQVSMPATFLSIGSSNRPPGQQGHTSISWTPSIDNRKNEVINTRVLDERLPGVSVSVTLHPVNSPYASNRHDSSRGPIPSAQEEARAGADQGI